MNRIQYKTIAEAMAITRCIARGELNKVADLIAKNRTAQIKRLKVEAQEFDATIQALRLELMNIETLCTQLPPGKYLNLLYISKKGQMATGLNKRFKNQAMMLKSTPNEIKTHEVNEEELSPKQKAYRAFFEKALKKFGKKSPADMDDGQKKKFFAYVKSNWKG